MTRARAEEIAKLACPEGEKSFMAFVEGKDPMSLTIHCFGGCQKCPIAMELLAQESGGMFVPGQIE